MLLSIVIPAWNEQARLLAVLQTTRKYCETMFATTGYEVIVVDDGSRDGTAALVSTQASGWAELRLISLPENRGKGAAVRTGCVNARGEFVLIYDADGATPIEQEAVLRSELTERSDLHLAMGVRYRGTAEVHMGLIRRGLGQIFTYCASRVVGRPCADTQCGFKMFRRETILPIIKHCRESGYTFDVELLAAIHRHGLAMCECSIPWTAVPGSKVSIIRDGAVMLWRLFVIRLRQLMNVFERPVKTTERILSVPTPSAGSMHALAAFERTAHD